MERYPFNQLMKLIIILFIFGLSSFLHAEDGKNYSTLELKQISNIELAIDDLLSVNSEGSFAHLLGSVISIYNLPFEDLTSPFPEYFKKESSACAHHNSIAECLLNDSIKGVVAWLEETRDLKDDSLNSLEEMCAQYAGNPSTVDGPRQSFYKFILMIAYLNKLNISPNSILNKLEISTQCVVSKYNKFDCERDAAPLDLKNFLKFAQSIMNKLSSVKGCDIGLIPDMKEVLIDLKPQKTISEIAQEQFNSSQMCKDKRIKAVKCSLEKKYLLMTSINQSRLFYNKKTKKVYHFTNIDNQDDSGCSNLEVYWELQESSNSRFLLPRILQIIINQEMATKDELQIYNQKINYNLMSIEDFKKTLSN